MVEIVMYRRLHLTTIGETDSAEGLSCFTTWLQDNAAMVDLDARDRQGQTLLGLATQLNRLDLMRVLLGAGADPNARRRSADFVRLLSIARTTEAATLLLQAGARVEGDPPGGDEKQYFKTPLGTAARSGNRALVQLFLAAGADVNRRQWDEQSPLLIALEEGHTEIARDLINAGAHIGLFEAALLGNTAVVSRRLESLPANASLSPEPDLLYEALWWAAGIRPSTEVSAEVSAQIIGLLIASGANPNRPASQRAGQNFGPLFRAAWSNPDCVEALLKYGADPTLRDQSGQTALHFADTERAVRALLEAGADVTAADENGRTPLHAAMLFHSPGIVRLLLDSGADVNQLDRSHSSPLMNAMAVEQPEVVHLLLEAGADTEIRNVEDRTALDLAEHYGYPGTAKILREAQERP